MGLSPSLLNGLPRSVLILVACISALLVGWLSLRYFQNLELGIEASHLQRIELRKDLDTIRYELGILKLTMENVRAVVTKVETEQGQRTGRFSSIESRAEGLVSRLTYTESRLAELSSRVDRLESKWERWLNRGAAPTPIP